MRLNFTAVLAAMSLAIVGCGCGGNQQSTDMNTPTQPGGLGRGPGQKIGKHVKVGIVFDSGGRGDKSFNDSAAAGTEMAKKDLDVEIRSVESKQVKDYESNLTELAEADYDLIIAIGNGQDKALATVAAKYPSIKFAIVDNVVDKPNVRSLIFSEEQGSFLAGYVAGLATKTGKIGFVGGMHIPLIEKFDAGYEAGAKAANPKVEILPAKYTDNWDDIDKGKAAADVLFNDGADIVYHASGRCGIGVINSAKEHGKYAIGVDGDQDEVVKGSVLTSMIKHVDEAVYQTIKDAALDKFTPGTKVFDLRSNGVGLSQMKYAAGIVGKDKLPKIKQQVAKMADQIKAGKIVVPTKVSEVAAFVAKLPSQSAGAASPKKKE